MLDQIKETLAHLRPEEDATPLNMAKDAVLVIDDLMFNLESIGATLGLDTDLDTDSKSPTARECSEMIHRIAKAAHAMRKERDLALARQAK